MAIFNYVAIDKDGKETKGKLEVAGNQEAMDQIRQKGLYPISITEEKSKSDMPSSRGREGSADAKPAKSAMTISFGRVTAKQVTIFTRQLATLIGSGLPLVRALYVLERQEKAGLLKSTIRGLAEQVEGGSSFSEALSKFPRAFEPLYVNTVKAGEAGGVLEVVLTRLAEFAEKSQRLEGRIKSAMIYPALVLTMALSVLGFLITF
ncbi:MAG: type II secretion system F family protein, partial [Candidatus Omnitrophica bacterium]|nr:type II secretion system F family protein [Candidatus Omnitrophota bacterium]